MPSAGAPRAPRTPEFETSNGPTPPDYALYVWTGGFSTLLRRRS